MLLHGLSQVLGGDKGQDSHFPKATASAPARCAVALAERSCRVSLLSSGCRAPVKEGKSHRIASQSD